MSEVVRNIRTAAERISNIDIYQFSIKYAKI